MAREDTSERGLPSPEVRRQILQHAGMILHEARELMAQLDRHETAYPRTECDHRRMLWRTTDRQYLRALSDPVRPAGSSSDAARRHEADQTLIVC